MILKTKHTMISELLLWVKADFLAILPAMYVHKPG